MSPRRLAAALRRLYVGAAPRAEHRSELEKEMLAHFDRRPDGADGLDSHPTGEWGFRWLPRWAVVGVVSAGVTIGACRVPVQYEVDLGERLAILLPATSRARVDPDQVARYIEENYAVERIEVGVRLEKRTGKEGAADGESTMRIQLGIIGDLDIDEVWLDLERAFPALAGARVEGDSIDGEVDGTLGGMLSHELLDLIIDRDGVEAAREEILRALHERGLEGVAEVEVERDGAEKRVKVRVEVHATGAGATGD